MFSLKREAIEHLHMQLMPMQPFVPHSSTAATAAPYPEAIGGGGDGVPPPPPPLNVLRERAAQSAVAAEAAALAAATARAQAAADAAELQRAEEDDATAKRYEYFAWMRERESIMRGSMRCGGTMLM